VQAQRTVAFTGVTAGENPCSAKQEGDMEYARRRRGIGGISLGGVLVIIGIVVALFWSIVIGVIIAVIGLVAFGGFVRGRWY
jgi:hypothetical protein